MPYKTIILAMMLLIVSAASSFAAVITLKNGDTIGGIVVEKNRDYIKVDTGIGIPITYYTDEIEEVWNEPINKEFNTPQYEVIETLETTNESSKAVSKPRTMTISGELQPPVSWMDRFGFWFSMIVFLHLLGGLFHYITSSHPLFEMANEADNPLALVSWIPIAQLFVLCRLSLRPSWYMILMVIPFLGLLVRMYVYAGLASQRGKSAMTGLLTAVPVVGLALPWYLAHSE